MRNLASSGAATGAFAKPAYVPTTVNLRAAPGTAAAVRCNCLVPKGAVRTHIGYYRLYQNSSVAAYNSAHPYIGPHADRRGFAGRVAPQSGAVVLTF